MRYRIAAAALASIAALALMTTPSIAQTSQTPTPAAPDSVAAADSVLQTAPPPAQTAPPAQAAPPPAQAPAAQTAPPPPQTAPAETAPPPAKTEQAYKPSGPFDRGRTRASFTAGWGRSFGDDYLLLGIGLGRFIKTGLELGLNYEAWVGSDPGVSKLSPRLTYVVTRMPRMTPYLGGFYTWNFIQDHDDLNSIGARAGIFRGRGRASYGIGAVYEDYLDCDESTYGGDCPTSTWYPEVFVSTSF